MLQRETLLDRLRDCVGGLDSKCVNETIKDALSAGLSPAEIVTDGISKGLQMVGQKFSDGEYFLTELIIAGEVAEEALLALSPYLAREKVKQRGRVVIGTVEGDIHDIGKNIVVMFLKSREFDVIDLGVDVSRGDFVGAVQEHKPQILAMSALMTHTAVMMGEIIRDLKNAGLREKVKAIIGGAPTTREFGELIGADYQAVDPLKGVEKCLEWAENKQGFD